MSSPHTLSKSSANANGPPTASSNSNAAPFGYNINFDKYEQPDPAAPEPTGPSLLNTTETEFLEQFVDQVGSNNWEGSNFFMEKPPQTNGDGGGIFGLGAEIPPDILGFSSSIPHEPIGIFPGQRNETFGSFPFTSEEDILAATALMQNGHGHVSRSSAGSGNTQVQFESTNSLGNVSSDDHPPFYPPFNETPQISFQDMHPPPPKPLYGHSMPEYAQNMAFSPFPAQPINYRRNVIELQYGSDSGFVGNGYVPPPGQETIRDVEQKKMQDMECLEPQSSANNTRPPSPHLLLKRQPPIKENGARAFKKSEQLAIYDSPEPRPKKRRKSRARGEEEADEAEDDDELESPRKAKGRKLKAANQDLGDLPEETLPEVSTDNNRRSISGGPRENLSEAQKRNNHIISEQKRRTLIKVGFEDMCNIVPDLRVGGYSKSAMLSQAADWLEDMLRGNEELKSMITTLSGDNNSYS